MSSEAETVRYICGPRSAEREILAAVPPGTDAERVSVMLFGSLDVTAVEWVGIEPPAISEGTVNLAAPELRDGVDPLSWGYRVAPNHWSWSPEGSRSCFAHTDLMVIRLA